MRATLAIVLVVVLGVAAATVTMAGHNGNHQDPTPSPTATSEAPPAKSLPPMPPGGYFTQSQGKVSPTVTLEYDWQRVEIRATILGVHFNINQQARSYDSSADDWTGVFHLNAPFRSEDYVSFCGPQSSITIHVRDNTGSKPTVYEGTITEVPPC